MQGSGKHATVSAAPDSPTKTRNSSLKKSGSEDNVRSGSIRRVTTTVPRKLSQPEEPFLCFSKGEALEQASHEIEHLEMILAASDKLLALLERGTYSATTLGSLLTLLNEGSATDEGRQRSRSLTGKRSRSRSVGGKSAKLGDSSNADVPLGDSVNKDETIANLNGRFSDCLDKLRQLERAACLTSVPIPAFLLDNDDGTKSDPETSKQIEKDRKREEKEEKEISKKEAKKNAEKLRNEKDEKDKDEKAAAKREKKSIRELPTKGTSEKIPPAPGGHVGGHYRETRNFPAPPVGMIRVSVSIPMIGAEYKATFQTTLTMKQVKVELLKKMAAYGTKNTDPECYFLSIMGLALLDESLVITQVMSQDEMLELKRPFHFQITGGSSVRKRVIIEEIDLVKTATEMLVKSAFYGLSTKQYSFKLECTRKSIPITLKDDIPFIAYCLRTTDSLIISAIPAVGTEGITEKLTIEYSPYDSLDEQKKVLCKSGFIFKQGGAEGGARTWRKRWFDLGKDGSDMLVYSENATSKVPKGSIPLMDILEVKDVTVQTQLAKDDKENSYLQINTNNRSLLLRFAVNTELHIWKEAIREFIELVQVEYLQAQKDPDNIFKISDSLEPGRTKTVRRKPNTRNKTFLERIKGKAGTGDEEDDVVVSVPFMARKDLSLNADFKWSSSDNPKETFDFLEELGVGASGRVIKAKHKKLQNFFIAVKIIPLSNKEVQEEIEKEMEILQTCRSDNVIAYYGCILRTNDTWILMDYCGAGSVKDVMKVCDETLIESQLQYVIQGTLKGLAYLHGKAILHLDIKAANILLTEEGVIKLADFGVSQTLKAADEKVQQDDFVGSPLYMSPEVILKKGYNDRTDVWSLGITIIEMAQGRPPNNDVRKMDDLVKIVERPSPTFKNPRDFSQPCKDFLARCLQKDPEVRPGCIALLADPFMFQICNAKVLLDLIWQSLEFFKQKRKAISAENDNLVI